MSTIATSPESGSPESGFFYVQILVWYQILVWTGSGTRFWSGLGLDKIQISVLKLKNLKKMKIEFGKSKNFEKIENLERSLKISRISKIFNFSNFRIFDFNFQVFQFSSFSILKLKFEFCPDQVQIKP